MDVDMYLDDRGKVEYKVSSEKAKANYFARKTNDGHIFYKVEVDVGKTPECLSGKYSGPEVCKDAIVDYLTKRPASQSVKRDNYRKMREEQKQNAVQPDSADDVQQRASD